MKAHLHNTACHIFHKGIDYHSAQKQKKRISFKLRKEYSHHSSSQTIDRTKRTADCPSVYKTMPLYCCHCNFSAPAYK